MLTADEILDLIDQGRTEDALAAYEEALPLRQDDLDLVADAADFFTRGTSSDGDRELLERGLELAARAQKLARRDGNAEAEAAMKVVEAAAFNQLGDSTRALARVDEVLAVDPKHCDALLERGLALYELCRFEEARTTLTRAVELTPVSAAGHYTLGLVEERLGNAAEAQLRFANARELAPGDFPEPVSLSSREFDDAVEKALEEIPESVRTWLANVAITIEDLPTLDDLTSSTPPLSPSSLGMFRGTTYGEKASMDPWSHFPSSIVLYQRNLERFARDRDELIREIGITLVHEVGHFLGLDEDDLWERGLD